MPIAYLLDFDTQSIRVLTGNILAVILQTVAKLLNLVISPGTRRA